MKCLIGNLGNANFAALLHWESLGRHCNHAFVSLILPSALKEENENTLLHICILDNFINLNYLKIQPHKYLYLEYIS